MLVCASEDNLKELGSRNRYLNHSVVACMVWGVLHRERNLEATDIETYIALVKNRRNVGE